MGQGSVAIVGAGIAGLACARQLRAAGLRVAVFEKSRSFGGRCASRLWKGHVVDHGAQYFTLTDPRVRADLLAAVDRGHIQPIESPILDLATGAEIPSPKGPRYYYGPGNNRIGKALAAGLDLRMRSFIGAVEKCSGGRWMVAGEVFDSVVVTCPYPQAAALLGLDPSAAPFVPCLTTFFEYEGVFAGDSALRYAWVDHGGSHDLAWSACENHKIGRITGDRTVFVVQASERFSRANIEEAPESYAPQLRRQLESLWAMGGAHSVGVFAHRWRYARLQDGRERLDPDASEVRPGVYLSGDALGGSRIEGAWKCGLDTALRVIGR